MLQDFAVAKSTSKCCGLGFGYVRQIAFEVEEYLGEEVMAFEFRHRALRERTLKWRSEKYTVRESRTHGLAVANGWRGCARNQLD